MIILKQRIYFQKSGALNEQDRLAIASLLIKAGYSVRIGREKPNNSYLYFIEYWKEDD